MNKLRQYLLLVASVSLFFVGCSDKSSSEACLHQVTMDLDKGNYNAVLASSCANDMQKGAANFGLAGFDIKNVINRFSETGSSTSSSPTSTRSDLNTYMTTLVSNSSGTSLTYLDRADSLYSNVTTTVSPNDCKDAPTRGYTVDNCKDAQFYRSLVNAVNALSLINIVLPNILNPDGSLNTACDKNVNGTPDEADATACALLVSAATYTTPVPPVTALTTCTERRNGVLVPYATVTHSPSLVFSSVTGTMTFNGLTTTMTGTGSTAACIPANTVTYKRLVYKVDAANHYTAATTANTLCTADDGTQWPCPIMQNGQPLDLVSAFDATLTSAISSMGSALSTGSTGTTDVQTAIQDIKIDACPTGTCTSQNIADYLQTNLH
jgi:hypothetical protein